MNRGAFALALALLGLSPAVASAQDDATAEVTADEPGLSGAALSQVRIGDRCVADNDFLGAAGAYAAASAAAPRAVVPRLLCAVSLLAAKRARDAVTVLRQAQSLAEDDLVTALLLQGALTETGANAESEQIWLDCVRRFPNPAGGLDSSGSVRRLLPAAARFPNSAILHLLLGDAYQIARRWPQANSQYRLAMASAPQWAKPRVNYGVALLAQGKAEEAVRALEDGLAKDPSNVRARLAFGDAQLQTRKAREALDTYQGLERNPEVGAAANIGAGRASLQMGNEDQAKGFFRNAQRLAPKDPAPLIAIGELQNQSKDFPAAVNSFSTALRLAEEGGLFSARSSLLRSLAEAQVAARRPDDALRTIRDAREREPAEAALWHRMEAQIHADRGDFVATEASLRRALDAETSLYPQPTLRAIEDRGLTRKLIAAYQLDLQGARTGIRGGVQRNGTVLRSVRPSRADEIACLAALGHLYHYIGDDANEVSIRRDLCRLRGTGPDWFLMAAAFERTGRSADARAAYREAVTRGGLPASALNQARAKLD